MTTTKTGIRLDEFSRRGWYEAYGAHIATARSGDVCVQRIDYDALDASDIAISTQLGDLTRDDRAKLIALARAVRSAADSVGDLLDDAVAAYASGDVPATIAALAEASRAESDHGDDPSTQALRRAMGLGGGGDDVTAKILIVLGTDAADDALAQRMDDALAETAWVIDRRADVVREWLDGDEDDEGVEGLHFDVTVEAPGVTTGPGDYLRTDGGTWQVLGHAVCYEGLREITERAWDAACAGPRDDRD